MKYYYKIITYHTLLIKYAIVDMIKMYKYITKS